MSKSKTPMLDEYITCHLSGRTVWSFEKRAALIKEVEAAVDANGVLSRKLARSEERLRGYEANACDDCGVEVTEVVRRVCEACLERGRGG